MRKLKLFMAVLAIMVGGENGAWATGALDYLTVGNGWSQVTSTSEITTNGTDAYVFVANLENSTVVIGIPGEGSTAQITYQTLSGQPDRQKVWLIENNSVSGFSLKNLAHSTKYLTADVGENEHAWNLLMKGTATNIVQTSYVFSFDEGILTIQTNNEVSTDVGYYWGDWSVGSHANGNTLAGNKAVGDKMTFKLFKKSLTTPGNDVTFMIGNNSFETGDNTCWTYDKPNYGEYGASDKPLNNGSGSSIKDGTYVFNAWWTGVPLTQTVTHLPNGKYEVSALIASSDGSNDGKIYLTAYSGHSEVFTFPTNTSDVGIDCSYEFTVSDHTATIGIVGGNDDGTYNENGHWWYKCDNFRLKVVEPFINEIAIALPGDGAMTADTWYYFDVPATGTYYVTATTLGNIIYSTDGTDLPSEVSSTFSSAALTASTRYYVKSSSANTLNVFSLGDVTAKTISEGQYLSSLTTFEITYANAAVAHGDVTLAINGSPAPVATLKKNGESVATGTLSADNTNKKLIATFSDVDLVLDATDYSITFPANAFGYEALALNSAITVNFNTPQFNGDYYLKVKSTGAYFAAGNYWGTQAISTINNGHIVNLAVCPDGTYHIDTYISNGGDSHYLNNNLYCDNTAVGWTISADGDYYTISYSTNKLTAGASGAGLSLTSGEGDDTKWTIMTPAAWKAENVIRLDAATSGSGVDATFYLPAANFNANDTENNKWQGSPGIGGYNSETNNNYNAEKFNTTFDVYQDLTGLEPGIYKVTMQGYYRNGTTDDQNAYLYANDKSVALVNIRSTEKTAQDDDKGFTTANAGGTTYYVPNSQTDASKSFINGFYNNELTFAVGTDGKLRIGVKKTASVASDWTCFDNFQLTYYGDYLDYSSLGTALSALVIPTLGFENGEYAPYTNASNLTTIDAARNLYTNKTASSASEISTAVTALGSLAAWTANVGELNAIYDGDFANYVGTFTDKKSGIGSEGKSLVGWDYSELLRRVIRDEDPYSTYIGLGAITSHSAIHAWGGGDIVYGNEAGYTIPLKGNTSYRLSYKIAAWSDSNPGAVTAKVKDGSGTQKLSVTSGTPDKDAERVTNTNPWKEVNQTFTTGDAGDYTLSFSSPGSTQYVLTDIVLRKAAVPVTIGSTNYATFSSDYAVNFADVTNMKAYQATYMYADNRVKMTKVTGTVAANTGLLLEKTGEGTLQIPIVESGTSLSATNKLKPTTGSDIYAPASAIQYVLANQGGELSFYKLDKSFSPSKGKAYLELPSGGGAARLSVVFDDEETGIASMNKEQSAMNNKAYNLQGQRIDVNVNVKKGLYIVNGKKIIKR